MVGTRESSIKGAAGWVSAQRPASVLNGEAHGEESAQVEGGDAVVEPVVVLLDPAVGHSPVASGEPGDRSFDHRSVLAVGGLEAFVGGSLAVLALKLVVLAEQHGAARCRSRALLPPRAAPTGHAVGGVAVRRGGTGDPCWAGQRVRGGVVGEVVDGEAALDGGLERPRLEQRE